MVLVKQKVKNDRSFIGSWCVSLGLLSRIVCGVRHNRAMNDASAFTLEALADNLVMLSAQVPKLIPVALAAIAPIRQDTHVAIQLSPTFVPSLPGVPEASGDMLQNLASYGVARRRAAVRVKLERPQLATERHQVSRSTNVDMNDFHCVGLWLFKQTQLRRIRITTAVMKCGRQESNLHVPQRLSRGCPP